MLPSTEGGWSWREAALVPLPAQPAPSSSSTCRPAEEEAWSILAKPPRSPCPYLSSASSMARVGLAALGSIHVSMICGGSNRGMQGCGGSMSSWVASHSCR